MNSFVPPHRYDPARDKPPPQTIGVVGIGSEEAVGATPVNRSYQGPEFGDVRDVLVGAPKQPYADLVPSYICSDIFPAKVEAIRDHCPNAHSVLEVGAFFGHFLLAALEACPDTMRNVWWCDNEQDSIGSNAFVKENLEWWAQRLDTLDKVSMKWAQTAYPLFLGALQWDEKIDVVHIDGNHTTEHAIAEISMALLLEPKMILVDDTIAHEKVRVACEFVKHNTGLQPIYHTTVNGFAVILP